MVQTNWICDVFVTIGGDKFGYKAEITKSEDEWFIIDYYPCGRYDFARNNQGRTIKSYSTYFKCDQIEGVLEFLKDCNLKRIGEGPLKKKD